MAEAIQLDSNMSLDFISVNQLPSDLILAQTEVTQSVPDQNQLVERASKAMDKDDKKKMGEEKYNQFHKIKKILKLKNNESKNMARLIEEVLDGKTPDATKEEPKKEESSDKKDDKDGKSDDNRKKAEMAGREKVRKAIY